MIVVDLNDMVVGQGNLIERVNEQNEENLIKVWDNGMFYYIGTEDRDEYIIYPDLDVPDIHKFWKYVGGEFEEVIYNVEEGY
jgi:hypothetical protein